MRHEAHNAIGARLGVELRERAGRTLLGNLQVEEWIEQRGVELERGRLVLKGVCVCANESKSEGKRRVER